MDTFLRHLSQCGGLELAASAAGISRRTVRRHRDHDADFSEEVEAAQAFYADGLEWEHVQLGRVTGNPAYSITKLKAERPARWIEKAVVLHGEVGDAVSEDQARAVLHAMLSVATPSTRQMIEAGGNVVEAEAVRILTAGSAAPPA